MREPRNREIYTCPICKEKIKPGDYMATIDHENEFAHPCHRGVIIENIYECLPGLKYIPLFKFEIKALNVNS